MESKLHHLSGSSLFVVQNKHQKTANLTLRLILAAGISYIESFEVWYTKEEEEKYDKEKDK